MWSRYLTKLIIKLLKSTKISLEDRTSLTASLLDKINAIPPKRVIMFDEQGTILIQGKPLELEQAIAFRESCRVLKDSYSRKILRDQLVYKALELGIHNGLTPDMIMFSKAILYQIQEEEKLLERIITE